MTKYTAAGAIEWTKVYPGNENSLGALREVVELPNNAGYVAVGWKIFAANTPTRGSRAFVLRVDSNGEPLSVTSPDVNPRYLSYLDGQFSRAYSIRPIFTTSGSTVTLDGFIVGGTANTATTGTSTSGAQDALWLVRLDTDCMPLSGWTTTSPATTGRVFGTLGLATSLAAGFARPVYSTGTLHLPGSSGVPAYQPAGTGASLLGFAMAGFTLDGTNKQAYFIRTDASGGIGATGTWEYVHPDVALGTRDCQDGTETNDDYGTDCEQTATGDLIAVGEFDQRTAPGTCVPLNSNTFNFNEADVRLIGFPLSATPTAPNGPAAQQNGFSVVVGNFSGRDWLANVVPTPDGGAAVLGSTGIGLLPDYGFRLVKTQTMSFAPTTSGGINYTPPPLDWSTSVLGPGQRACGFGLCLTSDGGYVVSGDCQINGYDDASDDDLTVVKLKGTCPSLDYESGVSYLQLYQLQYPGATSSTLPNPTASAPVPITVTGKLLRVRGTMTVPKYVTLRLSGTEIQFDDTRRYGTGSWASVASRLVVEAGGALEVLDGSRLTVLTGGGCSAVPAMWDGIVVRGAVTGTNAAPAGTILLKNAIVEKAHFGIVAGQTTYTTPGRVSVVLGSGGGTVTATNTAFRNCHTAVYLVPSSAVSRFTVCTLTANEPLADSYYTSGGVRYGMQFGIRTNGVADTRVYGGSFVLVDGSSSPFGQDLPTALRGTGISATSGAANVYKSTSGQKARFRNLNVGITLNSGQDQATTIQDAVFVGLQGGVQLTGFNTAQVKGNTFQVGRGAPASPYGLGLYQCQGFEVTNNVFVDGATLCTSGRCTSARGIIVSQADGLEDAQPRITRVYRNYFRYLNQGIYIQRDCQKLVVRCNNFTGRKSDTPRSITRADIESVPNNSGGPTPIYEDPMINPLGACTNTTTPAGNQFSKTYLNDATASARDILISTTANTLDYSHHNSGITTPSSPSGIVNQVNLLPCQWAFDTITTCLDGGFAGSQTTDNLKAVLDTATDAELRAEIMDELLRRYLTDTLVSSQTRVDSAVALLRRLNDPAYQTQLSALEIRGGYTPASRMALVKPTARARKRYLKAVRQVYAGRAVRTGSTAAATSESAPAGTYYDEVRDLLTPFGSDSAIAATLRADWGLRSRLLEIARDTLTWGYPAGQGALSYYLGYQFGPWYESGVDTSGALGYRFATPAELAAAEKAKAAAATLSVYPNPTSGAVRLSYHLPVEGELRLTDRYGRVCRTVHLTTERREAELNLYGLVPDLYYYACWVNGKPVQRGTLVKLP